MFSPSQSLALQLKKINQRQQKQTTPRQNGLSQSTKSIPKPTFNCKNYSYVCAHDCAKLDWNQICASLLIADTSQ